MVKKRKCKLGKVIVPRLGDLSADEQVALEEGWVVLITEFANGAGAKSLWEALASKMADIASISAYDSKVVVELAESTRTTSREKKLEIADRLAIKFQVAVRRFDEPCDLLRDEARAKAAMEAALCENSRVGFNQHDDRL